MDEPVVLACGRSLETTLKQMHGKGYAHNDIKAANVYITADGENLLVHFKAAPVLLPHVKSNVCFSMPLYDILSHPATLSCHTEQGWLVQD